MLSLGLVAWNKGKEKLQPNKGQRGNLSFRLKVLGLTSSNLRSPNTQEHTASHRFCNLEISSRRSCKSSSLILSVRDGINVLASSAFSQHNDPMIGRQRTKNRSHKHNVSCAAHVPSCARSNFSRFLCALRRRSTASTFSFCVNRAKWSR